MKYITPYTKHPSNNLPNGRKRKEANYVGAFGKVYRKEIENLLEEKDVFEVGREVHIPSLGIADLVSIQQCDKGVTLCAFEMKIKGWRKALAQAYRYKYYANAVYVVLPPSEANKAKESLELFRTLNVGLLAFDPKVGCIIRVFSPVQEEPISRAINRKALKLLASKFRSLLSP